MKRRSWSAKQRLALFTKHGGACHICNGMINVGEAWDVSHEIPLALGGADDDVNAKPAHRKCHKVLTAKTDIPTIAKAVRREQKHVGAVVKKQPIRSAGFPHKPVKADRLPMPPRRDLYAGRT